MIRKIRLSNFKCFENLDLNCAPLTLLCGLNGMGKSSVIQALLLLRQSFESEDLLDGRLVLGGELADLGTGRDVLFEGAENDVVGFEIESDETNSPWKLSFGYSQTSDQLTVEGCDSNLYFPLVPPDWQNVRPFGQNLLYIDAERVGPQKSYPLSETMAQRAEFGLGSEYALNYLNMKKDELLAEDDLRCVESHSRRMIDVVDEWLQEISPGAHLQLETVRAADALIAGFSFDRPGDVASRRFRATNVGFGLSYTLPVIIALLSDSGTLCLIENPEAHLHPRGQTKLAELAVRASLSDVQVIVETHSDHFMDGVRIAVRDGLISPDKTAIHYFERPEGETVVTSPQIDEDGRLSTWPAGFFDQHEENLEKLLAPKY
ncbi:MAG: DUF3696 domain-containing protein [Candidatus Poribacteria bacterium]|nr:DUF3696 domain-containing protein [Candidatus Poribacteria bacterium]